MNRKVKEAARKLAIKVLRLSVETVLFSESAPRMKWSRWSSASRPPPIRIPIVYDCSKNPTLERRVHR